MEFLPSGKLNPAKVCASCVMTLADEKVDEKGAAPAVAAEAHRRQGKALSELPWPAGCNLVRCEDVAEQTGEVPPLVCVLTREEHKVGQGYGALRRRRRGAPAARSRWIYICR